MKEVEKFLKLFRVLPEHKKREFDFVLSGVMLYNSIKQ